MLNTIIETTKFTSVFLLVVFVLMFLYCKCIRRAIFEPLYFIQLCLIAALKVLVITNGFMLFVYYLCN